MHIDACKEFYANLTMSHYKKKEVAQSRVRGVEIEFDRMRLASILGVPDNTGIYKYIKEVWEESKYIKPLEITRKFANDEMINEARREAVVDEAVLQGESGSGEKFYDAEEEVQGSATVVEEVPKVPTPTSVEQKETEASGVDPSALTESIPDSIFMTLQADFERARANRIQAKLEKAQAENARLLALLQQAKAQLKP
ncbi:hypothetical protein Dimus_003722 [Dionaea muscipula]